MGKGRRFKKVAIILAVFIMTVVVTGVLLLHNANRIIKAELESALGRTFPFRRSRFRGERSRHPMSSSKIRRKKQFSRQPV